MNLEGVTYRRGLKGGDFGFSYVPKKIDGAILSMQISMTMMFCATILIIAEKTGMLWLLFVLVVPIGIFFYIFIKSDKDRYNRRLETEAALNGFTDDEVQLRCRSVYGDEITCKHRAYIIRQKGTTGEFKRMFAAYLSNGVTVVFPVIQRTNEKGKWSLTIKGEPEETSDNGIVDKSLPPGEWLNRMINPDKNAIVGILLYLLIWAVLLGLYVYPVVHYRNQFLFFWGGYLLLMVIMALISRYVFKIPPKIEKVLLFPGTLAGLILNLSAPIFAILAALIIPCLMGIFSAAAIYGLSYVLTKGTLGWNLNYALFLSVASTSILTVYGNKGLMKIYERSGLFQSDDSKSLDNQFLGLVGYIFQKGNTNALVYSLYFLFIVVSSINFYIHAENANASIIESGVDMAVMKAFLVHIAFTNVIIRRREMKLSAIGLLGSIMKALGADKDDK